MIRQTDLCFRPRAPNRNWILTWSDEFTGPNGSSPDATKWAMKSGGNGWGNEELEYYTPRAENLRLENGNLVIEAVKKEFAGSDGVKRRYTSGRIETLGRFAQAYGRFEARIKIPSGQGVWPAFWLLGDDFLTSGWPKCGEIDVMENVDVEKSRIHGSIHGPGYSAKKSLTSSFSLRHGQFSDDFHVFAVEWEPESDSFLRGRRTLCDQNSRRSTKGNGVGLQPSLLHHSEPGGWREFAGKPGYVDGVSAAHAGRLRSSVLAKMRGQDFGERPEACWRSGS